MCHPDHRLGQRNRVTVPDLEGEMILRFPPGWGIRAVVDTAVGATQSAVEIINYSLMAKLIRAGSGTTLLPASAIEGDTAGGLRVIEVDDARMRWNLSAAVSAERLLTAATKTLLDALIQGCATASQDR